MKGRNATGWWMRRLVIDRYRGPELPFRWMVSSLNLGVSFVACHHYHPLENYCVWNLWDEHSWEMRIWSLHQMLVLLPFPKWNESWRTMFYYHSLPHRITHLQLPGLMNIIGSEILQHCCLGQWCSVCWSIFFLARCNNYLVHDSWYECLHIVHPYFMIRILGLGSLFFINKWITVDKYLYMNKCNTGSYMYII